MNTETEEAKSARVLGAWASEARLNLDAHPDNDLLLDYHDGGLRIHEAETLRDHLALCRDCSRRGLELAVFSRSEMARSDRPTALEAERQWAAMRQALELMKPSTGSRGARRASARFWIPSLRFLWRPGFGYAAAGLFLVINLAQLLQLMSTEAELRQPRVDVQLVDLQPIGAGVLRDASVSRSTSTAANDTPLLLILSLLDPGLYSAYRVEILHSTFPDRGKIWSTDNLKRSSEEDFTVLLPPGIVLEGKYRVRLYGIEGGRLEPLAEYALTIERR